MLSGTRIIVILTLTLAAAAHSQHHLSPREVAENHHISKRCASAAGSFVQERKKRSIAKRNVLMPRNSNVTIHTEGPHFSAIQNNTCIMNPNITPGPYYWPRSETLRQDMREDQAGIPLYLDIGVLDTNTCEPAPDVLLDLWHCNATGSYSSFESLSPNIPFLELLKDRNITNITDLDLHTDDSTWLRGMWPTDANGVSELVTNYPGFYVGRAIHIHVQAHTDWVVRNNGTIVASNLASTGQIYFDEEITEKIMAMAPYNQHTEINRTTNSVDLLYPEATKVGWNPNIQIEPLDGVDVANGMIGYITFGVNVTATSPQVPFLNSTQLSYLLSLESPTPAP
ncbi:uncharacterized protein EKO05_0007595 [Ascochyta rabiei]|uniref:Ferric iron binding n=1 Tax=Didymella rabiei TaxID=5454 RepID=A0A163L3B2_DIDRA|nr:uncharacterized protein EKO05_0007595 [Ascochyta rabiei]KZM27470.1 ferric iron binding [Ascochyta rabiei]UPX17229.1 hypothetical protein EKO05_0007595 [Ascochyta rabiei]